MSADDSGVVGRTSFPLIRSHRSQWSWISGFAEFLGRLVKVGRRLDRLHGEDPFVRCHSVPAIGAGLRRLGFTRRLATLDKWGGRSEQAQGI
jgi:hypothetical protein